MWKSRGEREIIVRSISISNCKRMLGCLTRDGPHGILCSADEMRWKKQKTISGDWSFTKLGGGLGEEG